MDKASKNETESLKERFKPNKKKILWSLIPVYVFILYALILPLIGLLKIGFLSNVFISFIRTFFSIFVYPLLILFRVLTGSELAVFGNSGLFFISVVCLIDSAVLYSIISLLSSKDSALKPDKWKILVSLIPIVLPLLFALLIFLLSLIPNYPNSSLASALAPIIMFFFLIAVFLVLPFMGFLKAVGLTSSGGIFIANAPTWEGILLVCIIYAIIIYLIFSFIQYLARKKTRA